MRIKFNGAIYDIRFGSIPVIFLHKEWVPIKDAIEDAPDGVATNHAFRRALRSLQTICTISRVEGKVEGKTIYTQLASAQAVRFSGDTVFSKADRFKFILSKALADNRVVEGARGAFESRIILRHPDFRQAVWDAFFGIYPIKVQVSLTMDERNALFMARRINAKVFPLGKQWG